MINYFKPLEFKHYPFCSKHTHSICLEWVKKMPFGPSGALRPLLCHQIIQNLCHLRPCGYPRWCKRSSAPVDNIGFNQQ